jgi:hypothetical protein
MWPETSAAILFTLGCIAALVGEVRFLVVAYRHGTGWLFACLFIPPVALLFFLMHMKETWPAMLLMVAGYAAAILGYQLGGFSFMR